MQMGSEILDSVSSAVDSGDYRNLSRDIQNSIENFSGNVSGTFTGNGAEREVYRRNTAQSGFSGARRQTPFGSYGSANSFGVNTANQNRTAAYQRYQTPPQSPMPPAYARTGFQITPFQKRPVSRAGNVAAIVLGAIGMFFSGGLLAAVGVGIANEGIVSAAIPVSLGIFSVALGLSAALFGFGISGKRLKDVFLQYARVIGRQEYISLQNLALQCGQTVEKVKKNLKKMMKKGLLGVARFDKEETTLMLTDKVYHDYVQTELRRQQDEFQAKQSGADSGQSDIRREQMSETEKLLYEGRSYIKMIRDCNDKIPGVEVSTKLDRLEEIMNRVFEQVERDPSSAKQIRRLMEYYLPTTEKLLKAYIDLDKQPETLENVKRSKKEIEDSLDMIIAGTEKLLDGMFETMSWDISSDINVMKTMMAQDGLVDDGMPLSGKQ